MREPPLPRLPHWSTYDSAGSYYRDYRGRVPIQMMQAISGLMTERGLTFREASRQLLRAGKIIHIDPADDIEPEPGEQAEPG